MDIQLAKQQIQKDLESNLLLIASRQPLQEVAFVYPELAKQMAGMAICCQLIDDNQTQFREWLIRAVHCRKYFLKISQDYRFSSRFLGLARFPTTFCSLAAGHLNELKEVWTQEKSIPWQRDWEYPDDHYYLRIITLAALLDVQSNQSLFDAELVQFEQALEGESTARLEFCQSLCQHQLDDTFEAFEAILEETLDKIEEQRPTVMDSNTLFWANCHISIEGLALLNLLKLKGINASDCYVLCPSEARLDFMNINFYNLFEDMEQNVF